MRKEHLADWNLFQRAVALLLAACMVVMFIYTTATWIYLSAISREIAVMTTNHSESVRALLAITEQQATSNMRLDAMRGETNLNLRAIRDELHALNEKAAVATDVKPPQNVQP